MIPGLGFLTGIGGKILGGLGILAGAMAVLFQIKKAGRDQERLRQTEGRLDARESMDTIRRDAEKGTLEEKREEAKKWSPED
jgi:hypothetical protein